MTFQLAKGFSRTLRHRRCWRKALLVFVVIQHNGTSGCSSHHPRKKITHIEKAGAIHGLRTALTSKYEFSRSEWSLYLTIHSRLYPHPTLQHYRVPPPSFQKFLVGRAWLGFGPEILRKIPVFGTTTTSSLAHDFHRSLLYIVYGTYYSQNNWLCTLIQRPLDFLRWQLRRSCCFKVSQNYMKRNTCRKCRGFLKTFEL